MRLAHRGVERIEVVLSRESSVTKLRVGDTEVQARIASVSGADGDLLARYWIEEAAPQRVLRWELAGGESAQLIRSARLAYWQLNAQGGERHLEQLGLVPRPARTP
jgi:hypothetical protein